MFVVIEFVLMHCAVLIVICNTHKLSLVTNVIKLPSRARCWNDKKSSDASCLSIHKILLNYCSFKTKHKMQDEVHGKKE